MKHLIEKKDQNILEAVLCGSTSIYNPAGVTSTFKFDGKSPYKTAHPTPPKLKPSSLSPFLLSTVDCIACFIIPSLPLGFLCLDQIKKENSMSSFAIRSAKLLRLSVSTTPNSSLGFSLLLRLWL